MTFAEQAQRKLAAILHADVVGYSRLMAEDDAELLVREELERRGLLEELLR